MDIFLEILLPGLRGVDEEKEREQTDEAHRSEGDHRGRQLSGSINHHPALASCLDHSFVRRLLSTDSEKFLCLPRNKAV